jgi:hypothetical protein
MQPVTELIIPKPAVSIVIAALNDGLPAAGFPDVYVSGTRPSEVAGFESLPKRFVRVTRAGGGMMNRVTDNARILFECWSDDSADAEVLANAVRGLIAATAGQQYELGHVRGVGNVDDGPTSFPDPIVPSHDRWQFQVSVMVSTN